MLKQFKVLSIGLLSLSSLVAFSAPMFEAKGVNAHVRVRTLTPNHTYTQAGIKINTPGYSLAKAGTQCTKLANGYCTFTVSDKKRKTLTIAGPAGTVGFTLCLNGVGKLSCQNYTAPVLRTPVTFTVSGLITNLMQNGLILQNLGTDDLPLVSGALSYMFPERVPQGGSYEVTVAQQPLGQTCAVANSTGTNVQSNVIANVGCRDIYTYISDNAGVHRCLTNGDGTLGNCILAYPSSAQPYGVVLNKARTFALVSLLDSGTVASCAVNLDGTFVTPCPDSGVGAAFNGAPTGVTLNPAQTMAYVVTGNPQGALTKCNFNAATGKLSNCSLQPSPNGLISFALGITVNSANTYAYIASPHNSTPAAGLIARCAIQANGSLANCGSAVNIYDAQGIFFNKEETLAYVASDSANLMYRCNVVNGNLLGCTALPQSFAFPFGGEVNNRNSISYVVNGNSATGTISMCQIGSAGGFTSCRNSGAGPFNFPNYMISAY